MKCVICYKPIVKGEEYYRWAIKMQRGGIVKYQHVSHGAVKQSQLTNSKLSEAYAAIEDANALLDSASNRSEIQDALEECSSRIGEVRDEYQSSLDALPENFQQAGTGEQIQEKIDELENFISELENVFLDDDEYTEAAEASGREADPDTGEIDVDGLEPDNLESNKDAAREALDSFSL